MIIEGGIYTFDNVIKIVIYNRYSLIKSYLLIHHTKTFTRETINETLRELIKNNSLQKSQRRLEGIIFFEEKQDGYLGKIDDNLLNSLKDFDYRETLGEWT